MSINISKKIKLIRKVEQYKQREFAQLIECSYQTFVNYELDYRKPSTEFMQKLCKQFPEYTLWLMTGEVSGNQISPEMKATAIPADKVTTAQTD